MSNNTFLVSGAAGFIGSNFVFMLAAERPDARIVVIDKLTYAGNLMTISSLVDAGKITFVRGDIADTELVEGLLAEYTPAYVINFAAESHVDRSVNDPTPFITTNIDGTFNLLECCRRQRDAQLKAGEAPTLVKFVQVSTDEVYGDLEIGEAVEIPAAVAAMLGRGGTMYGNDAFTESTPLCPSSPYSASKASADMLVMSYHRSFGMPVTITRCSNNYGPRQFPEKLIPLMINNIMEGRELPVYGQGLNVRDWIHVDDHCAGVLAAAEKGEAGQMYNFGGYSERRNIDIVRLLLEYVGELAGTKHGEELIRYVKDRPGHDLRYAIDAGKAMRQLGWRPRHTFEDGLRDTVAWYLDNKAWCDNILSGEYRSYYKMMYSDR